MAYVKKIARKDLGKFHTTSKGALSELLSMTDDEILVDDFGEETEEEHVETKSGNDFDIAKVIEDEIESFNPIARDMRIDDSSIPRAKNFYHFCTDESFLDSPPYLEQALIGIKFMAEYCVHCSDLEWMHDDGHEADEGLSMLESKVICLEFGVCPSCGARRTDMIRDGELKLYNELAVCAGQRCVTGDTIVYTKNGMAFIRDFIRRPQDQLYNGKTLEDATRYYISPKKECIYKITLTNGLVLRGSHMHPVNTTEGWVDLGDDAIKNKIIPVEYGTRIYGTRTEYSLPIQLMYCTEETVDQFLIDYNINNSFVCDSREDVQIIATVLLNHGLIPTVDENTVSWGERLPEKGTVYLSVTSVQKARAKETVYDVNMAESHCFLTNGMLSHNSGKSAVTTMIAAYILHRFLMVGKPNDVFGIRSTEILHGTFIALTLGQAKENLWDPFHGYITNSPWFRHYHKFLRYHEKRLGEQLFNLKDTFIKYRHRNMMWYPATPDKRVLRGRTRLFGAIDELGWFDASRDTNKVKDNAHEVYKALSNSLATARQSESRLVESGFDQLLTGYMVNVSSPSSIRDKIVELVRVAKGSNKILGLHKPTWKMNPHLPRNSPIIEEEFRKDPLGAARDFGAEPSLSSYPFLPNHGVIIDAIREKGANLVKYRLRTETIGIGKGQQSYRTGEILNVKKSTKASILSIDAGFTNNSFALSCGSLDENNYPSIDCLVEIIPMPGVPLNYTSIYNNVIRPLVIARNVKVFLADRWNSIKLLQDAQSDEELRLEVSRQYSLKYVDMYLFRDALDQGQISIPRTDTPSIEDILDHDPETYPKCFEYRPTEHFILQLATIQDVGKKQVIKGDGFTDDLWRASALTHWGLLNPEYLEILNTTVELAPTINYMANAVRKMTSLGGKGVSSGGNKTVGNSKGFLGVKRSMR